MYSTMAAKGSSAPALRTRAAEEAPLVEAAKNGDSEAFESLVTRNKRLVLAITRRMSGSVEEAEDLTQQAFMKAFANLSRFGGRCSFSTWLVSIAINEARMWSRKTRRSREIPMNELSTGEGPDAPALEFPDRGPSPEETCSEKEWSQLLFSAMETLSPGTREALRLCDLEEEPTISAAVVLGVTVNAVKSRRLRGRLALRRRLESSLSARSGRSRKEGRGAAAGDRRRRNPAGSESGAEAAELDCLTAA